MNSMKAVDSPNTYIPRFKRLLMSRRCYEGRSRLFNCRPFYKGSEDLSSDFWQGQDSFDFLIIYPPEMR